MKYLETNSTNPYYNLAYEELVLTTKSEGDYLMLWQNDNTIVIGQNQNTIAEINKDAVEKYHVNVVRRTTGGGAVYHDLGNLNYSFITDEETGNKTAFQKFTGPVVEALKSLGIPAEVSGRNDILVEGRKVSGIAQRHHNGRILHHGTLLFNEDLDRAGEVLSVDPDKVKAKGIKSVRSHIANISEYLPGMTLHEFWDYLKKALAKDDLEISSLNPYELAAAVQLKEAKYDTYEWNYGRSLAADITCKTRFAGGTVEVQARTEHGCITDIRFFGDYLSLQSLDTLEASLRGCRFEKSDIAAVLPNDLTPYFGSIAREEILSLF